MSRSPSNPAFKALLTAKSLTASDLAAIAGMSLAKVSLYTNARRHLPGVEQKLATAFGISVPRLQAILFVHNRNSKNGGDNHVCRRRPRRSLAAMPRIPRSRAIRIWCCNGSAETFLRGSKRFLANPYFNEMRAEGLRLGAAAIIRKGSRFILIRAKTI